jgi:4-diphosphocytidyl-2-C-methyl-D-erythritol kinase
LREDGYHELATVFMALSLFDTVTITEREKGAGISLSVGGTESRGVPVDDSNLAWRAAQLAAERFGAAADLDVSIDKGIPVAGGMAGGSADAAAVLLGCSALWSDGDRRELLSMAAELGSDVPFSVMGGVALGTGRGEHLAPAMVRGQFHWVIALSDGQLPTPKVYRRLDRMRGDRPVPEPKAAVEVLHALRFGDAERLGRALHNDLQPAAVAMMPPLGMLLELGPEHGALGAMVSGSGPTCGFLVADEAAALDLTVALSSSGLCRTIRRAVGPVPGAALTA